MPVALQRWSTFLYGALIKASFSVLQAPTHTDYEVEYDVIFQAELIVSGAQFSLSLPGLQSDSAWLHDAAVGPWEGSNEELWEAGCLLAVERGDVGRTLRDGRWERSRGGWRVKHEKQTGESMQWFKKMNGKMDPIPLEGPASQKPVTTLPASLCCFSRRRLCFFVVNQVTKVKAFPSSSRRWLVFSDHKVIKTFGAEACSVMV